MRRFLAANPKDKHGAHRYTAGGRRPRRRRPSATAIAPTMTASLRHRRRSRSRGLKEPGRIRSGHGTPVDGRICRDLCHCRHDALGLASAMAVRARRIGILAFDGIQSLDLTGPLEVFATAAGWWRRAARPAPYVDEISRRRRGRSRPIRGCASCPIAPSRAVRERFDTLIVAGGNVGRIVRPRRAALAGRRSRAACAAWPRCAPAPSCSPRPACSRPPRHDALGGRRALRAPLSATSRVEPDAIFVRDGNVYTSAGVTGGIDLALALVEDDLGHAIALDVARRLVVFLKRPGGQSQFSSHLAAQAVRPARCSDLPEWIVGHLGADLSVDAPGARAAMSPRHFARVFRRETGPTPAKFVERARLDAARRHSRTARSASRRSPRAAASARPNRCAAPSAPPAHRAGRLPAAFSAAPRRRATDAGGAHERKQSAASRRPVLSRLGAARHLRPAGDVRQHAGHGRDRHRRAAGRPVRQRARGRGPRRPRLRRLPASRPAADSRAASARAPRSRTRPCSTGCGVACRQAELTMTVCTRQRAAGARRGARRPARHHQQDVLPAGSPSRGRASNG